MKNVAWKDFKDSREERHLKMLVSRFGQILIVLLIHIEYK